MFALLPALVALFILAAAPSASAQEPASAGIDAALCRLIDGAAADHGMPAGFLTRLIFQESSFRAGAVSPAGAQGVAQFMPMTARERGLADPFDPEQAIPASAHFLAELKQRFGNWGLAAAAYNGGPTRVAGWLAGRSGLPYETEAYVLAITGREAEDWALWAKSASGADARERPTPAPVPDGDAGCAGVVAAIRAGRIPRSPAIEAALAPWGVQLAANFRKGLALAAFHRAQRRHAAIIAGLPPMVIGTRLRSRGTRAFYRVRLPAQTRAAAIALCDRIRVHGGACIVLRS